MADWPLKHDGPCACRFVRKDEFGEAEQVEWCGFHAGQRDVLNGLVDAVRVFRNEPALGRLVKLRGTPGYTALCAAWNKAVEQ